MVYKRINDLPKQVSNNLPEHAQHIYLKAFNNAIKEYADPDNRLKKTEDKETVASKVAWAAVKKEYKKDENSGKWVKK